ncbi:MAG: M48 family metalloprotease [Pseudomonadota bacterium]|nr:M48 family metalloprotease [Pseudomonadota bacterium]
MSRLSPGFRESLALTKHLRSLPVLMIFCLALSGQTTSQAELNLPELGDSKKAQVSSAMEARFADQLRRQVYQTQRIIDDPITASYVDDLMTRLAQSSQIHYFSPSILLIRDSSINAFAGPGQIIGVHSGLFVNADQLPEFAGVMAHELGHLNYKHFALMMNQAESTQRKLLIPIIAGILVAVTGEIDVSSEVVGMIATGQTLAMDEYAAYSRQLETEADMFALKAMADNHIDPKGLPDFFKVMLRKYGDQNQLPSFMLSHPISQARISYTSARLKNMALLSEIDNQFSDQSIHYQLVRQRMVQIEQPESFKKHAALFARAPEGLNKTLSAYRALIAYGQGDDWDQALELMRYLQGQLPFNPIIAQTIAQTFSQFRPEQAAQSVTTMFRLAPESRATKVLAYQYYLDSQQTDRALGMSITLEDEMAYSILYWEQNVQLFRELKQPADMHYSLAEIAYLNNQLAKAEEQLLIAKQLCQGNVLCQTKMVRRIDQVRALRR